MDQDTVDRHTTDWERIREAVAFLDPNEDEWLIVRKVDCPGCGNTYAMVLSTGAVVHYGKRHKGCDITIVTDAEEQITNG